MATTAVLFIKADKNPTTKTSNNANSLFLLEMNLVQSTIDLIIPI